MMSPNVMLLFFIVPIVSPCVCVYVSVHILGQLCTVLGRT